MLRRSEAGRLRNRKYLWIKLCILAYTGITLFAVFLKSQWQFWVLAVLVGMFQGGVQALSRSHFAKITPPEKSGEYFGLFDICGKGASFLGTMIVSVGSQLTGSANVGVGSLIVLFIVGFVLFRVENYCKKPVELGADGLPLRSAHGGYDLRSLRAAAQQHGGSMTLHWENNWSTLRILFPLTKNK